MIRVTYPAGTLDRSSPLGNRHAPTNSAYHVAGSEQAYAGMACQRNLRGRKHEPYFLDVPDICVGENTGKRTLRTCYLQRVRPAQHKPVGRDALFLRRKGFRGI
nr:MAG TPA: hypothetical protein [Caudoviricetes sp.]